MKLADSTTSFLKILALVVILLAFALIYKNSVPSIFTPYYVIVIHWLSIGAVIVTVIVIVFVAIDILLGQDSFSEMKL